MTMFTTAPRMSRRDDPYPSDCADAIRRGQGHPLRLSPIRQGRRVPIVFNQHYTGTMDYWDPAVTDGLARDREVILFNNAGVSSSSGEVPTTFEQMAPTRSPSSEPLV